jgi:recombination protein RecR
MYSATIQKLIDLFSQFPTVGPRTATRFVFYLTKKNKEEIKELVSAILELKRKIRFCQLCFNIFEPKEISQQKCEICLNPSRERSLLCVVANEIDLAAIEKLKKYNGLYFVLGGLMTKFKKNDLEKLRIKELEKRVREDSAIQEIILALNPTTEGEATALYLEKILKPFQKKISRLGKGLPVGGELEYADEETLKSALEQRK